MDKLISIITDPGSIAIIVASLAVLRAVGELVEKIGEKHAGADWFDSAGGFITKLVGSLGKFLNYFGIGNKQR